VSHLQIVVDRPGGEIRNAIISAREIRPTGGADMVLRNVTIRMVEGDTEALAGPVRDLFRGAGAPH
jgi:hypothetical protein